ncbi:MAG TPA: M15 family metallopeptidase [Nannocystis sp.]
MSFVRALHVPVLASLTLAPFADAAADEGTLTTIDQPEQAPRVCDLGAPPEVNDHPPPVNCAESKDTGYMSGNPFEITVVHIDGKPVEKSTANAYWVMREAAAAAGVDMHINSGFRTMSEQQYFYNCYVNCNCNNCNQAAKPGYSNHQSGHALDLNASAPGVYNWLAAHGGAYGFKETVASENWHWEWWGGGPKGGICDISAPPKGYLDAADCDKVNGWAQDPDAPDAAIQVHVYFNGPAGDAAAIGVPVTANEHREDLCQALGSCAHGFTLGIPLSLRDNAPHPVHAYGIDTEGGDNTQLVQSPGSFTCAPPALPPGVRRHVSNPEILAAWSFDTFWQMVKLDDATLLAIPEWTAIDPAPLLIRADDGTPEVWLVDGPVRRHVPNPQVAANWEFDLGTVVTTPAADVYAIPVGTPVWDAPILVKGAGPAVYQLDDRQCYPDSPDPECQEPDATTGGPTSDTANDTSSATASDPSGDPTPTSGPEETTAASVGDAGGDEPSGTGSTSGDTTGDTTGAANDDADGCGCRTDAPASPRLALGLLVLGLLARRRRA